VIESTDDAAITVGAEKRVSFICIVFGRHPSGRRRSTWARLLCHVLRVSRCSAWTGVETGAGAG